MILTIKQAEMYLGANFWIQDDKLRKGKRGQHIHGQYDDGSGLAGIPAGVTEPSGSSDLV
jgi:hypothetical protein